MFLFVSVSQLSCGFCKFHSGHIASDASHAKECCWNGAFFHVHRERGIDSIERERGSATHRREE